MKKTMFHDDTIKQSFSTLEDVDKYGRAIDDGLCDSWWKWFCSDTVRILKEFGTSGDSFLYYLHLRNKIQFANHVEANR